jgi:hypothetical protein
MRLTIAFVAGLLAGVGLRCAARTSATPTSFGLAILAGRDARQRTAAGGRDGGLAE